MTDAEKLEVLNWVFFDVLAVCSTLDEARRTITSARIPLLPKKDGAGRGFDRFRGDVSL